MTNTNTATKPVKPARGVCKWIVEPEGGNPGVLDINGTAYRVESFEGGFALTKEDGTTYHVALTGEFAPSCDCPDATYRPDRPGGCKHVKGLRAALLAIGHNL